MNGETFPPSQPGDTCVSCGLACRAEDPDIDFGGRPDPCLGVLPGVSQACCGHGIKQPYVVAGGEPGQPVPSIEGAVTLRGREALEWFRSCGAGPPFEWPACEGGCGGLSVEHKCWPCHQRRLRRYPWLRVWQAVRRRFYDWRLDRRLRREAVVVTSWEEADAAFAAGAWAVQFIEAPAE